MMKKLLCTLLFAIFAIGTINAQGTISGGSPAVPITTTTTLPTANTPVPAEDTDFGTVAINGTQQNTFTFTSSTALPQFLSVQNMTGTNASEFSISSPSSSNITGIGTTVTFAVNFNPTSSGAKTAIVEFRSASPTPFSTPTSYFFEVIGTGGAASPSINVVGDDALDVVNGSTNPSPGDNTHFGTAVSNVESVTRQYTIENNGTADLIIDNIYSDFGSTDFSVSLGAITFPLTIPASGSASFDVIFSPTSPASPPPVDISSFILIDAADDTYDYFYEVEGVGAPAASDMEVSGNSTVIADGDASPSTTDHTDFGDVDINTVGGFSRTFTIENTGTANLVLTSVSPIVNITGADAADFTVTTNPTTPIAPNGTTTFTVRFDPSTVGTKVANIVINNNTTNGKNPYNFAIQGNATDVVSSGQLLITQYYEGVGANDQWIEVKNISATATTGGAYNLCLYQDANTVQSSISANPPQFSIGIPALAPGAVHVFYNTVGGIPALPSAGNRGSATSTATDACRFDGNDVILISTSVGTNCYNDRSDIMGVVPTSGNPPTWGADKSFIKGCGTTELPTTTFATATGGGGGLLVTDYLQLLLTEVDNAVSLSNIAIGTQAIGTTTWTSSWDNGVPDKTRVAVISGTYTAADGSIAACDLTVTGSLNMDGGTTNYVEVNRTFTNSGTVTIGDQESLFTVNSLDPTNIAGTDVIISGSITKLETTTTLTNEDDYTYWSSPVSGQNTSAVFPSPTYNQGRIYYWDQSVANDDGLGGSEALGEWIDASGQTMRQGKGYISQGPVGISNATSTVSFSGSPHSSTITLTTAGNDVIFTDNGNGNDNLILIGNPYPSGIDADEFIGLTANTSSISGTLWFWTHSTPNNGSTTGEQYVNSDYASYNLGGGTASANGGATPGQYVGSGQGFMAQTISNSPSIQVTFNDAMRRREENTQFFRGADNKKSSSEEKDRVWLNLESSEGGAFSQILVGFFEEATDGIDYGYDGVRISENWVNLYSKIDTLKYGIQGLSSFTAEKQVPLALNTYISDANVSFNISIDRFEGVLRDNDIYLVDNELNITHDLKQGPYNFTLPSWGTYNDRFTLQFTKATLGVDDLELNNNFVIVNEEDALLVKSKSIIKELKMYDITGRLLVNMLPNESEFRINTHNIRKGTVLILNTTFENGTELSKKAIKY